MTNCVVSPQPLTLSYGVAKVSKANEYILCGRRPSKLSEQSEDILKVISRVFRMGDVFNALSIEWQPVRPDVAQGVYGKTLLANGIKLILTRVAVGGRFDVHQDNYGHLFYFLSGEGLVWVHEEQFKAVPGLVVRVNTGEPHAYENTGNQDLILISVNIPTN